MATDSFRETRGTPEESITEGETAHYRKELSCDSVVSGVSVKLNSINNSLALQG